MATLTFGVSGPSMSLDVSMQIADAAAPRIMGWLCSPASGYGTVPENVVTEAPDGAWSPGEGETEADRPTIATQSWVTRPATPEEAARAFAAATLNSLLSSTVAFEKAQAAAAAAEIVPPIEVVG